MFVALADLELSILVQFSNWSLPYSFRWNNIPWFSKRK